MIARKDVHHDRAIQQLAPLYIENLFGSGIRIQYDSALIQNEIPVRSLVEQLPVRLPRQESFITGLLKLLILHFEFDLMNQQLMKDLLNRTPVQRISPFLGKHPLRTLPQ